MTTRTQEEIRKDIDQARGDIAAKAAELSDRAAHAAQKLRLSHQVEQRPFTMLALSVVAGFAAERLLIRPERPVYMVRDEEERPMRPKKRKRRRRRRERIEADGRDDIAHGGDLDERGSGVHAMSALGTVGRMAAGMLARELATRLVDRSSNGSADPNR